MDLLRVTTMQHTAANNLKPLKVNALQQTESIHFDKDSDI